MDILAIIYRIKEFIITGVHNFPLIVCLTSLILLCATANIGYSILFVSLAFIVPAITWFLNKTFSPWIQSALNWIIHLFNADISIPFNPATSSVCRMAPQTGTGPIETFPSYWLSGIVFLFTFTFYNGLILYNYVASTDAPKEKVEARQAHAMFGMIASIVLFLVFLVWRLKSGCEHWFGVLMSLSFIGIAIGLFEAFKGCGLLRLVDLYGIGSRLLPMSATAINSQVCFPVAGSSASTTP
jgi:hypothetical protein